MLALPSLFRRRLGKTLSFYLATEFITPTLFSLFGLTTLVLTKDLLGFSDLVINRGLGLAAVGWIAFYEIVPLLSQTLPFAVLVGTLVGLGRLRADRELLAIEAAGVARQRCVLPVLGFALIMSATGLGFSLYSAPAAIRTLDVTLRDMIQENPGISLRPGTVHQFGGSRMVAREISARGDRLRGVLLWISDTAQEYFAGQTLFAERGTLEPLATGTARLVLYDGVILLSPQEGGGETRFQTFETILQESQKTLARSPRSLAGLSLPDLVTRVQETPQTPLGATQARRARTELNRRFAAPLASVVFGLLAIPLAFMGQRFSRAAGGVLGLVLTVVYYGLIQLGDGLAQAEVVTVGLGVWLPNIAVGLLALSLLWFQGRTRFRWWALAHPQATDPTRAETDAFSPRTRRALLQRYVVQHYTLMVLLAFGILFVGYLLVDILERLEWFARHNATPTEALRFYAARIPLLASRIVPMSLLLATALTVSVLSFHRELIGMRASGISATRTLSCILIIASLIAPLSFVLNEYIVPRTNALADRLKETEIKDRSETGVLQKVVWYRAGSHVSQATQLDPTLGEATDISIYELGEMGLPRSRTDARRATYVGDGMWELVDPVRITISENGLRREPAERLMQLGQAPDTNIDTMHLGVWQLAQTIGDTQTAGYDVTTYRVDLHVKLATPLACILLPAIALFFALNGPPFPGPAVTLLMSSLLGVSYILFTGVCASLGYGGTLSPPLAGWGPAMSATLLAGVFAWQNQG